MEESTPIATHFIRLDLEIGGRRIRNQPFVILHLGKNELIVGRRWLEVHDIWLDVLNRRLLWPSDREHKAQQNPVPDEAGEPLIQSGREITILRRDLEPPKANRSHQADVACRERLFDEEDKELGQPTQPRIHTAAAPPVLTLFPYWKRTEKKDQTISLRSMKQALPDRVVYKSQTPEKKDMGRATHDTTPGRLDIAMIGAVGMKHNLHSESCEVFSSTIYELDHMLELKSGRQERDSEREQQEAELEKALDQKASDQLAPVKEEARLKIELAAPNNLSFSPLYKHTYEELKEMKRYLVDNLDKGFITPSTAPFAAPILFARKVNGGLRFCVDYRQLNAITKKDQYPLPLIDELLQRVSAAKVFTKIDIRQAFHKIRIDLESEDLTTFRTRYGSYKYCVVPFGLTNGPAVFQHCAGMAERSWIAGRPVKKTEFHVKRTKYLGFVVTTEGIEVDPDKTAAVRTRSVPSTVQGVQSFLGFCNYYRRFIRDYGRIARPLNQLTRKDTNFDFNATCMDAFIKLKKALLSAPILYHYNPNRRTKIESDTSDGVVAGVLSQLQDDNFWHPIAYYSKSMLPAESNYAIHDKELLAIVSCMKEWRCELQGLQTTYPIEVYSDHKSLEYFMTKRQLNMRQAGWAEYLSRFVFVIMYRTGKSNRLADALSRQEDVLGEQRAGREEYRKQIILATDRLSPEVQADVGHIQAELSAMDPGLTVVDQILRQSRDDPELEKYREEARTNREGPWNLCQGLLLCHNRLLLDEVHKQPLMAHPGKAKIRRLVMERYYWKRMGLDIDQYVANCHTSRRSHRPRDLPPGLLKPLPIPQRPWQHISMDFMSFTEDRHGYDTVYVIVDRLGKRSRSIPCTRKATAKDMARLFITYQSMGYQRPLYLTEAPNLSPISGTSYIEQGFQPRLSFDWQDHSGKTLPLKEKINRQDAEKYARRMQEDTGRPAKKLDFLMAGPWPITEKVGNSYRVQLPASVKVHPIFSPDKLRRDPNKPLPGQVPDSPPPIEVVGELEYDVDEVIAVRTRRGKLQYQVQWTGYDDALSGILQQISGIVLLPCVASMSCIHLNPVHHGT
ncbi:hypothetical protein ACJ73_07374 [Blastomyces percursus]|uniref:Chromo domain-containing protein n=1 Tax=Blastomyces percursus TaxID=1658174 RepID=A0A1J9QYM0_9EURO|nr:hypothetical protein ACJ73_07374 [Blastomyces percursus]